MRDIKFPFLEHVGARLVESWEGYAKVALDVQEYHLQHLGFVHGGVISTLLDNTGWYAAMSMLEEGQTSVTMQINIDYLKPAKGADMICEAKVVKAGRSKSFVEIRMYDDKKNLVAFATGNYAVITPAPDRSEG